MRPNRLICAFFSLPALATSPLAVYLLMTRSAQAQSTQQGEPPRQPTAAEMSKKETVASAFLRDLQYQEYEVRSAAEAMPEEKYVYRPAEGKFKSEKPEFGPAEVRTFAQQVKHVACANFAFAAELDGQTPPAGPQPRQNQERIADLPARLVCRDSQIPGRHGREERVRSHRRPLRRAQYPARHRHRNRVA